MKIFVIAEIGINHNGDLDLCKRLIDNAVDCGADAVKFQKRDINIVYTQDYLNSSRESPWGNTQRDQKKGLEFEEKDYQIIDDYCKNKNIQWFASAWDINSLNFLDIFDLKYNKVASAMLVDVNFIAEVAKKNKHTFISTGMSTYADIDRATKIFRELNCPFELMHTISTYPMKPEHANLNVIQTLKNKFGCNVGYSGHETGVAISCAAAALGISSLERHITMDRSMYGSDQSASLEPRGLRELVGSIRKIESAMGDGIKKYSSEEKDVAEKLRQHIKS
tara:strand:+ start:792 stop:1628 length:837 start_codon:yes stop_codon:yes gene_type:complete